MSFLDRLLGDDHARAARHTGPSATEQAKAAARAHRSRSATKADRKGQAWEDAERHRERYGTRRRTW